MKASRIAQFLGKDLHGFDYDIDHACSLSNIKDGAMAFDKSGKLVFYNPFLEALLFVLPGVSCVGISHIHTDNPRLDHARAMMEFFYDPGRHEATARHRFPGVHIYDCVEWGEGCSFKPGVVLGGAGFGFERDENGVPFRRPHIGRVVIGNHVEIGANSVVARATFDATRIGNNVKIDDMVFIAHNAQVGDNTMIVAGSVICGSARIGCNCWIGANATIMNQITIGDNVVIGNGASVVKDVADGEVVAGIMAKPLPVMRKFAKWLESVHLSSPTPNPPEEPVSSLSPDLRGNPCVYHPRDKWVIDVMQ